MKQRFKQSEEASPQDDPAPASLTEAQRLELDLRLKLYREDPSSGSSWAEVKARLPRSNGVQE